MIVLGLDHDLQYISKLRCPFIKTKTQQNHNKITTKQKQKKSQKKAFIKMTVNER